MTARSNDGAIVEEPSGSRQRPNMYDVAQRAGVSHMTVSRVLNGHPNIKAATRERVLRAIDEMQYTRSSIARALVTRRTARIGVLVDIPVEYGPNSTLRSIEQAARLQGYSVASIATAEDTEFDQGVADLLSQGVDGICVVAPRSTSLDVLQRRRTGVPILVVKPEADPSMLTVAVDQRAGAALAVNHLVGLDHRSILHLAGPLDWLDARAREEVWREQMHRLGVAEPTLLYGDWTSDSGYAAGANPANFDGITAVFAANDQMALGLIHALSERGVRVPEEISVIGFDDVPDAAHFLPPLTTIRQDFAALGTLSVEMLLAAINDEAPTVTSQSIAPQLRVRQSTGRCQP